MQFLFIMMFAVFASTLCAGEWKNVPYYEKNAAAQGNVDYRKERCTLNLSTPDDAKDFPTLIYFHGGGLSHGKGGYPPYIDRKKIAVVAVNYRLSGDRAKCPDYIYDAAAATA